MVYALYMYSVLQQSEQVILQYISAAAIDYICSASSLASTK